jgi:hypothetical protein
VKQFNGLISASFPASAVRSLRDLTPVMQGTVMAKKASSTRANAPATNHDTNSDKRSLKIEIENLFDVLCAQLPMVHLCEDCGHEMINIDVLFFLDNERSWNIPLTICTKCNREGYVKFMSKRAA